MKLDQILALIQVRDYMTSTMNNTVLERKDMTEFGRLITLIDKKIINSLLSSEFKNSIIDGPVTKTDDSLKEIAFEQAIKNIRIKDPKLKAEQK